MPLNDDVIDIDKPGEICSPAFVVDNFLGLFISSSIFSIKDLGPP